MKKIKSITDVITNSSTEIFTCRTTKSLDEVSEFLKNNTSGYRKPEIMSKKKGCLKELIEGGYVVDMDDPVSINELKLRVILRAPYRQSDPDFDRRAKLKRAFADYLWEHKGEVSKYISENFSENYWINQNGGFLMSEPEFTESYDSFVRNCLKGNIWEIEYAEIYPDTFINSFLLEYQGDLSGLFDVHETHRADYYVGQIGFMGKGDNSIPYDTWDIIKKELNATNWHMG